MLRESSKAIVVSNYSNDLEKLRENSNVYFSDKPFAAGILDGLKNYLD